VSIRQQDWPGETNNKCAKVRSNGTLTINNTLGGCSFQFGRTSMWRVLPVIREVRKGGATTLRDIANALNARGISTPRGARWHATPIKNVLARA
jgi:Recombinase